MEVSAVLPIDLAAVLDLGTSAGAGGTDAAAGPTPGSAPFSAAVAGARRPADADGEPGEALPPDGNALPLALQVLEPLQYLIRSLGPAVLGPGGAGGAVSVSAATDGAAAERAGASLEASATLEASAALESGTVDPSAADATDLASAPGGRGRAEIRADVQTRGTERRDAFAVTLRGPDLTLGAAPPEPPRLAAPAGAAGGDDPTALAAQRPVPAAPSIGTDVAGLEARSDSGSRDPGAAPGAPAAAVSERLQEAGDALAAARPHGESASASSATDASAGAHNAWALPQPSSNVTASPSALLANPAPGAFDLRTAPDFEALAARIHWLVDQKVGEARLRLHPPELGALDIKISLVDDRTYVQMITHHAAARDLLEQSLPRLREMLAQGGLDVGGASVGGGRADGQPALAPGVGFVPEPARLDGPVHAPSAPETDAAGGIDIYA